MGRKASAGAQDREYRDDHGVIGAQDIKADEDAHVLSSFYSTYGMRNVPNRRENARKSGIHTTETPVLVDSECSFALQGTQMECVTS